MVRSGAYCRRDRALETESGKPMLRAMCVTNCDILWSAAAPLLIMASKRFTRLSRSMRRPPPAPLAVPPVPQCANFIAARTSLGMLQYSPHWQG